VTTSAFLSSCGNKIFDRDSLLESLNDDTNRAMLLVHCNDSCWIVSQPNQIMKNDKSSRNKKHITRLLAT